MRFEALKQQILDALLAYPVQIGTQKTPYGDLPIFTSFLDFANKCENREIILTKEEQSQLWWALMHIGFIQESECAARLASAIAHLEHPALDPKKKEIEDFLREKLINTNSRFSLEEIIDTWEELKEEAEATPEEDLHPKDKIFFFLLELLANCAILLQQNKLDEAQKYVRNAKYKIFATKKLSRLHFLAIGTKEAFLQKVPFFVENGNEIPDIQPFDPVMLTECEEIAIVI
ncbi:MAG: hypothetical protein N3A54_01555 [Patescibacteria group bacterium]|nr:hypothetical protein [Patescibacteria group bacterium]